MPVEAPRMLVQRFVDAAWHADPPVAAALAEPILRFWPDDPAGGYSPSVAELRLAFPDLTLITEDAFVVDGRVVQRWRLRGTHRGWLWGLAPTGRLVELRGVSVYVVAERQVVDHWTLVERTELTQALLGRRDRAEPGRLGCPWGP